LPVKFVDLTMAKMVQVMSGNVQPMEFYTGENSALSATAMPSLHENHEVT